MFKSINTSLVLSIITSAIMLVGCDKSDDESSGTGALSSDDSLLQYIPADSPYVFANVEALPDDLLDKLEPKIERLLQSYQAILREVIADKLLELSSEERESEDIQNLSAFIDELMTLFSIDGMRAAGIGRDATGALYGYGLLPVVRLQLTDGALFDEAITRLEGQAGKQLTVAEIDGHSYRYFEAEEVRGVIAVIDNQAVFALIPASFDADQTGRVLGLTLPETNIADAGVLQDIATQYGFTDHYVGFLDVAAVIEPFLGEAAGVNADVLALGDYDAAAISEVCRAEIRSVAGIVPRIVLGYTDISVDKLVSNVIIELREDIAAGIQGLTAAVPGLGGDHGGLMSFGMSLDVKAARTFMESRLDALEADPFECEKFAHVQAGVAGGREVLNQPLPPLVYDFKGFLAVVDDIEGLDIGTQTPPTSVDGSILLAMDNAPALVAMGTMFSPDLAALNLQADGKPVALELPQVQAMGIAAFAALTDSALALSVGDDSESEIVSMLGAEASDSAPFLSFSMDAARYYGFLGEAIAAGEQDEEDSPSPEMQAAMNDIMQAVADVYDRISVDVLLTEHGVEMKSTVILQD